MWSGSDMNLGRNALAPLGPSPLEHQAAGLGRHALAEAMTTGALQIARLERPLHGSLLYLVSRSAAKE